MDVDFAFEPYGDDVQLARVRSALLRADEDGNRLAAVLRRSFDQLYDGQHTGRFSMDQLTKTEKAHYGTIVEINLRREFDDVIQDGGLLDYSIEGIDVDCKFSIKFGGWMIPPEAFGKLLLVLHADDRTAEFSGGLVRATPDHLRTSRNRDGKTSLNPHGRARVDWLWSGAELPPNVLLQLDPEDVAAVFGMRSGQQRVNELFRRAQGRRVARSTVATVAQQDDFMKRVRANGGARSALAPEGIAIFAGDYREQRGAAAALGLMAPLPGEFVSARVHPATADDVNVAVLDGRAWRLAHPSDGDCAVPAPVRMRSA